MFTDRFVKVHEAFQKLGLRSESLPGARRGYRQNFEQTR